MNILVIAPHHSSAVDYHRLIIPFSKIENVIFADNIEYYNEYTKETIYNLTREYLIENNIGIVWFSRNISPVFLDPDRTYRMIRGMGAKIVIDVDDNPFVDFGSIFHTYRQRSRLAISEISQITAADYVCVTNEYLANVIIKDLKVDKRRLIIAPNGIDPNEPQYNQEFTFNLKNVFWQGSVTHHTDLKQMAAAFNELNQKIFIAGYNPESRYIDKNGNTIYHWEETGKLFKFKQWIHYSPVTEYMKFYQNKGICVIPLEKTKFTQCKSNLKMLEAGWAKKAVIASGIHPYNVLGKDGANCEFAYTKKAWIDSIKYILENPSYADDLRFQLHEDVKENYLIDKVNQPRKDLINKILQS